MHWLSLLLTLLTAALASASAIAPRATTTSTSCKATDVAWVKQRITHPVYFCTWYLSAPRTASPLTILSASALKNACTCIVSSSAKQTLNTVTTAPTSSVCSATDLAVVNNEYKNPEGFCSFWTSAPRTNSPIPGKSVKQITQGCKCLSAATSTSPAKKTTTTATKHVTSTVRKIAVTKTSTCSKTPLATSIGNFASGLASWTATSSGTASVATGSSYDSSGSAAKLSCTYASSKDTRSSICSPKLNVCTGQQYSVSFRYKWLSGTQGGVLNLYDYGWNQLVGSIEGPEDGGCDEDGVAIGTWAKYTANFTAQGDNDVVLFALECLSGGESKGTKVQVLVDNVRYTRL